MSNPPPADRILILRLGAMGDVIRTLPAVAALRACYPGAHLTWLVEPASVGVVEASGLVDEILVFPRRPLVQALKEADPVGFLRRLRRFLRVLRDRRFEISVDFHGLLKSGALAWLSGAPIRFGYPAPVAREWASIFANRHAGMIDPEVSRFDRNAALVEAVASGAPLVESPLLAPSALAKARLTARLRASGREKARDFVLLHPGSSVRARHKRYPATGWAAVARALAEGGQTVWITCGPDRRERSLAEDVVRLAGGALVLAPETRSFDDLLALQARARVFVAADSGPLHAASLAGVPAVQLVGPTHPRQNAPWRASASRRVRVPPPCAPCRGGCARPVCMTSIPAETVVQAIRRLLVTETTDPLEADGAEPVRRSEARQPAEDVASSVGGEGSESR